MKRLKRVFKVLVVIVLVVAAISGGVIVDRVFLRKNASLVTNNVITNEESNVISVVERTSASVVTVSGTTPRRNVVQFNPFNGGFSNGMQGGQQQDIGSGFIVSSDGLIVTNKHVVADISITYKVVTSDNKEYSVDKISRDPNNDIAVLKIGANNLIRSS